MKVQIKESDHLLPRFWVGLFTLGFSLLLFVEQPEFSNLLYELPESWAEAILGTLLPSGAELYEFDKWVTVVVILLNLLTLIPKGKKLDRAFLWVGWVGVFLFYLVKAQSLSYNLGVWMEGLLMISCLPIVWLAWSNRTKLGLKVGLILATLTFAGHGLFALNWYPRPGIFIDMVIRAFHCSESSAELFLMVIGVLDLSLIFLVAFKKTRKYALWYMVIWGLLTALARPLFNFDPQFASATLAQWIPEALIRAPHFLIPLWLLNSDSDGYRKNFEC
ncbi:hypothetical protein KFE98_09315 [bacterium SCSIO 12741]|nr:hypothetical protein KFE98_09315 [bacterium SCSIO 12741]